MPVQRNPRCQISHSPDLIVGAGIVTSYVWRIHVENSQQEYRFDLVRHFRAAEPTGYQLFSPDDLPHLVNWIRVLIQELLNDGWLSRSTRTQLKQLLSHLDDLPCPDIEDGDTVDDSQDSSRAAT